MSIKEQIQYLENQFKEKLIGYNKTAQKIGRLHIVIKYNKQKIDSLQKEECYSDVNKLKIKELKKNNRKYMKDVRELEKLALNNYEWMNECIQEIRDLKAKLREV